MKKIIYALATLALSLSSLIAQTSTDCSRIPLLEGREYEGISLRAQSTGGAVLDHLDRSFDPIELRFIDGFRLFTNFGNYDNGRDRILSGKGQPEYLVGFATTNPFLDALSNAFLFKHTSADNGQPDLIVNGRIGYGEVEIDSTSYSGAVSGNSTNKETISAKKSALYFSDKYAYSFNNAYTLGNFIIGGKLNYATFNADSNRASVLPSVFRFGLSSGDNEIGGLILAKDADFEESITNYDLINNNFVTKTKNLKNDFLTNNQSKDGKFELSAMLPDFAGFELRGDLGYLYQSKIREITDSHFGTRENFSRLLYNFKDYKSEQGSYKDKEETTGGDFVLATSLRKILKKADKREDDDFVDAGLTVAFGSYDYKNSWERHLSQSETKSSIAALPNVVDTWTVNNKFQNQLLTDDGDLTSFNFGLNSHYSKNLNDAVKFASAASWTYFANNRETDYKNLYDATETSITGKQFDSDSSFYASSGDYKKFTTATILADHKYETFKNEVKVNSGLEFKFTENKKWVMRVGSEYKVTKIVENDKLQIKKAEPEITKTYLGDGSFNESTGTPFNYGSTAKHSVTTTSLTTFSYGIGYYPNDNLQIDIAGVFDGSGNADTNEKNEDLTDLTFIKSLKLGFSLKF